MSIQCSRCSRKAVWKIEDVVEDKKLAACNDHLQEILPKSRMLKVAYIWREDSRETVTVTAAPRVEHVTTTAPATVTITD